MGSGASAEIRCALSTFSPDQLEDAALTLDPCTRVKLCQALGDAEAGCKARSESSGHDSFMLGQYVQAHCLKAEELNGKRGVVVGFQDGRVRVMFAGLNEKALKAINLILVHTAGEVDAEELLRGKSVAALRHIIAAAGFPWQDCLEKDELVVRACHAMDATVAAQEVAKFGKVLPKLVSLTVQGLDGEMLFGPEEVPDDTPMSDIVQDIAATKSLKSSTVKLVCGHAKVEGSACVASIQHDDAASLLCVISSPSMTDTFRFIQFPDTYCGLTEISIVPYESKDEFLEKCCQGEHKENNIGGLEFLKMLMSRNIMQLYLDRKPAQAERLKDLISGEQVLYVESLSDQHDVLISAYVAGHLIVCVQDVTAQRIARDTATKAEDLERMQSSLLSLFSKR